MQKKFAALAFVLALSASPVLAGDFTPMPHLIGEANGIVYATGGVGEEEREALKAMESDFNLRILTSLVDGAFVGDYTVRILDKSDNVVLEAEGDGPWFMVQLSPGTYKIEQLHDDVVEKSSVTLAKAGSRQITFRWK